MIVGSADNGDVLRLEGFLARNGHPHQRLDPETDSCGKVLIERFQRRAGRIAASSSVPTARCCAIPTETELARCLGLVSPLDPGPALRRRHRRRRSGRLGDGRLCGVRRVFRSLVLDCRAFGGQAGASARIENYSGFPTGISGMALMARAYNQAQKFGAEIVIPCEAQRLECPERGRRRSTAARSSDERVRARAVVLACGARYRRLDVDEPARVRDDERALLGLAARRQPVRRPGGGAGRRRQLRRPGDGLSRQPAPKGMAARARRQPRSEHVALSRRPHPRPLQRRGADQRRGHGAGRQRRAARGGPLAPQRHARSAAPIRHLFLFIGADPNTDWLRNSGVAARRQGLRAHRREWPAQRASLWKPASQASSPSATCARAPIKRVAASVGEGAQVVAALHAFLADHGAAGRGARLTRRGSRLQHGGSRCDHIVMAKTASPHPRVVSLIASSTELLHALGAGDLQVAPLARMRLARLRCSSCRRSRGRSSTCRARAPRSTRRVRSLVEHGLSVYEVNADALEKLKPDVILTQDQCEVCAVSLADVERAVCKFVHGAAAHRLHAPAYHGRRLRRHRARRRGHRPPRGGQEAHRLDAGAACRHRRQGRRPAEEAPRLHRVGRPADVGRPLDAGADRDRRAGQAFSASPASHRRGSPGRRLPPPSRT